MRKVRDLERALEKEKNANLQLHLQLQKACAETANIKTECRLIIKYHLFFFKMYLYTCKIPKHM